tara:strand:- start:427 stop:543 length:117 start_codon:yes stop_codon:yes gene_type:complete
MKFEKCGIYGLGDEILKLGMVADKTCFFIPPKKELSVD